MHKRKLQTTGDPMFDLIAGVYRMAIWDARQGKADAIQWLWVTAPDVAERLNLPRGEYDDAHLSPT